MAHLHVSTRRHHLTQGMRFGRVELDFGLHGRQKPIHTFLVGNIHRFIGMGKKKSIQYHHDRQVDLFGKSIGQQGCIENFLAILAIELNPACIPLGQTVCLIHPDIPPGRQRTINLCHDDG